MDHALRNISLTFVQYIHIQIKLRIQTDLCSENLVNNIIINNYLHANNSVRFLFLLRRIHYNDRTIIDLSLQKGVAVRREGTKEKENILTFH